MKRSVSLFLLALFLLLLSAAPAFAFPPSAFSGAASSQTLDLTLDLSAADLAVAIGALEASEAATNSSAPTTSGDGDGVDVVVSVGDPNLAVDLINVASIHTLGDGPNPDTDSESLATIDTEIVDLAAAEMDTSSFTTNDTVDTSMNWTAADLVLHGDILGASDLLSSDTISGTADTNVAAGGMVSAEGHSRIEGLVVAVPLGTTVIELVTADLISTTASAANNGTMAGASASAKTEFVNLLIQGEVVSNTPGTVIDLEIGTVVIGSVTIRPVEESSATTNQSTAEAIALRIEILPVLGLIGADMDVGATSALASVPSSPTAVTVTDFDITTGASLPYAFLALALLAGAAGRFIWLRRG